MTAMTHEMPRAARFWNRMARKYAAKPVGDADAYQYKLDRTAAHLQPDMKVLEFGCGTGTTALIHGPRVARIDAIDFSSEMIAIAREKAIAESADNVFFEVAAIEDWPVPEEPYDAVMAHSILHLVADLDATLARVHAMLKPGGLFISSTVCIRDMSRLIAWFLPLGGMTGLIPKVTPLGAQGLGARIERAGFEIVEASHPGPERAIFIIARAI